MRKLFAAILLPFALASCSSVPKRGWLMTAETVKKGVQIELTRDKDGSGLASIVSPYFGDDVEARGFVDIADPGTWDGAEAHPNPDYTYEVQLTELRYFGNWPRGWTEATFELSGRLRLKCVEGRWRGELLEEPKIGTVKIAKLRFMDSYMVEDQAIRGISNRVERIKSAVGFWRNENGAWFELRNKKFRWSRLGWEKGFAEEAAPFFFPERYGYLNGFAPEGPWQRGDGISWDTEYTKACFPEQLWEVRNSGTLFRDWEEGLGLWFLVAQWNEFWLSKFPYGEIEINTMNGEIK